MVDGLNIVSHFSLGHLRGRSLVGVVGEQPDNVIEFADDSDSGGDDEIVKRQPLVAATITTAAGATAVSETNRKKKGDSVIIKGRKSVDIEYSNSSVSDNEKISHSKIKSSIFDMNSVVSSLPFDFGGESNSSNRCNVDDEMNNADEGDDDEDEEDYENEEEGDGEIEERANIIMSKKSNCAKPIHQCCTSSLH